MRPPAATGAGAAFSFLDAAAVNFFAAIAAVLAIAGFLATVRVFAAGFDTIVVPVLVLLASLLRPSSSCAAGRPGRLVVRLLARVGGLEAGAGFTGLAGRIVATIFSEPESFFIGERGSVREL